MKAEKIINLRKDSIDGWQQARTRSKEVMKYIMHDPFTAEEKDAAEERAKPLLRYNVIISKLQSILGNIQTSQRSINIVTDSDANEQAIRVLSDNYDYIREDNNLFQKLTKMLADGLLYQTGGWMRASIEQDDLGYNTFKYSNIDTLSVHPDKDFREVDLSDCKYIIVDAWMGIDEIKAKYRKNAFSDGKEAAEWWKDITGKLDSDLERGADDGEYKKEDKYLVCQMEERIETPLTVVDYNGQYYKLSDDEMTPEMQKNMSVVLKTSGSKIKITTIVPYFDELILEEKYKEVETDMYSLFFACSFDYNLKKAEQPAWGYLLVDVQDDINKARSQERDYMTQKLGGSWHLPEHETKAIEALKNGAGDPNLIVTYKSLKNKAVRETGAGDAGSISALQNGIALDLGFVEEISNITQAMQGKGGKSAESGRLFEAKRDQSLVSSNPFYEIFNNVHKQLVRHFLTCVPSVYFEDNRLLPTLKNNSLKYELVNLGYGDEVMKDVRIVVTRAILDDVANTPNRKKQAFEENMAMTDMLLQYGYPTEYIPFNLLFNTSTIRDKEAWNKAILMGQEAMVTDKANQKVAQDYEQIAGAIGKGQ